MNQPTYFAKLTAKTKISCDICGCNLPRIKTFKVSASTETDAKIEAREKIGLWKKSLEGQTCRVCKTILNDLNTH